MDTKIGLYICSGCGIKDAIDIEALSSTVDEELGCKLCKIDPLLCGDECQAQIKSDVETEELNRVIIAGCSGRYFADKFDFGGDVLVDRVPMREFVAWTIDPDFKTDMDEADELY